MKKSQFVRVKRPKWSVGGAGDADERAERTTRDGAGPPLSSAALLPRRLGRQKCIFSQLKRFFIYSFLRLCALRARFLFLFLLIYARGYLLSFSAYTRGDMFLLFVRARGKIHLFLFVVYSSAGWVKMEGQNCCRGTRAFLCAEKDLGWKTVRAAHVKMYGRSCITTTDLIWWRKAKFFHANVGENPPNWVVINISKIKKKQFFK